VYSSVQIKTTWCGEGIQKYIDEHNATLNEDDVRDFIDAYLLDIKHHEHEKNTLFTGK
jgi:hypothetical protein